MGKRGDSLQYWRTGSGKKVSIKSMTDPHLLNCIGMLQRWAVVKFQTVKKTAYNFQGTLHGDVAVATMEDVINTMEEEESWEDHTPPTYGALVKEAEKRSLKIPDPEKCQ